MNDQIDNLRKRNFQLFLNYSCCFVVMIIGIFGWYFIANKTFIWGEDGWEQHYKALIYYGRYLRRFLKNFLLYGNFILPQWDFAFGEGSDILTVLHYYVIGDPLTLLSAAVPTKYMWCLYDGLILLRLYLAGLAYILLCLQTGIKNKYGILAGTLSYVFCSWALFNTARHPYFLNPMIYAPLLICGIEYFLKKRKPWLLVASVFLSAVSNFYFFYMLALMVAVHTVVRLLILYPKQVKMAFAEGIQLAMWCVLGTALAAVVLCPVILTFLDSGRMSVQNGMRWLYPVRYYINLPLWCLSIDSSYWLRIGFSALIVPAVLLMFRKKKHLTIRVLMIICVVIVLSPVLGKVTNGFSYITNRWCWALSLLASYILTLMWPHLILLSSKDFGFLIYWGLGYLGYVAFARSLGLSYTEEPFVTLAFMFVFLCISSRRWKMGARYCQRWALSLTAVSLLVHSYYLNAPTAGGYIKEQRTIDSIKDLNNNETKRIQAVAKEENKLDFYRYSGRDLSYNAGVLAGLSSTNYYWSIANLYVSKFRGSMALPEPQEYRYLNDDDRSMMLSLASVRYFAIKNSDDKPVPFGFTKVESKKGSDKSYTIYENEYMLPLTYGYDEVISKQKWSELNEIERQEALLQTLVLEDDDIYEPGENPSLTSKVRDYQISYNDENVKEEDTGFVVTKANSSITLNFEGMPCSETYVVASGISYEGFSPKELKRRTSQNEDETAESAADRLLCLKERLFWSEPAEVKLQIKSSTNVSKTMKYYTPYHSFYSGRHDFALSLNYNEEPVTSVTITFSNVGKYSFEALKIICQPMEQYPKQIENLAETTLKNVVVDTDHVSGTICLEKDKWLCFAIPYSTGWSALVDGEKTKLHHANIQYMALPLSAGEHTIELIYERPFSKLGLIISGAAFIILIAVYVYRRKQNRKGMM